MKAFTQNFVCETNEDAQGYAMVYINCKVIVDQFGVCIDAVKQSRIREAIRQAVLEAVTVEEKPKKEEKDGQTA